MVHSRQKPFHVTSTESLSLAWGTKSEQRVRVRSVRGKALDDAGVTTGQKRRARDEYGEHEQKNFDEDLEAKDNDLEGKSNEIEALRRQLADAPSRSHFDAIKSGIERIPSVEEWLTTQSELETTHSDIVSIIDTDDLMLALNIYGEGDDLFSGMDFDSPPGTPTNESARSVVPIPNVTPEKPTEEKRRRLPGRPRKDGLPPIQRKQFAADQTPGLMTRLEMVAVPVPKDDRSDDSALVSLSHPVSMVGYAPGLVPPIVNTTLFSFFNVRKGLSLPLDLTADNVNMSSHKKKRMMVPVVGLAPEKHFTLLDDLLCHESNDWMDSVDDTWRSPFKHVVRFTIRPAARREPPQGIFDIKTMRLGQALGMGQTLPASGEKVRIRTFLRTQR